MRFIIGFIVGVAVLNHFADKKEAEQALKAANSEGESK